MTKRIYPGIYMIEIPLPNSPLKAINSYLIKGRQRNLIIDTGMNRKACREAMDAALLELGVRIEDTDFFFTHLHADHFGMVSTLPSKLSKIYFNEPDANHMRNVNRWNNIQKNSLTHGVPADEFESILKIHPSIIFQSPVPPDLYLLKDGDILTVGGYSLQCIETPGHSRGHMCLYEASHKILFGGDHILDDITPNISGWTAENPLREYLSSLNKIGRYDIQVIFPGHRSFITDFRKRIADLKNHHKIRCDEILSILGASRSEMTAYDIASRMTWDLRYEKWDDFPVYQRWFAAGEAVAHIHYLLSSNKLMAHSKDGKVFFATVR